MEFIKSTQQESRNPMVPYISEMTSSSRPCHHVVPPRTLYAYFLMCVTMTQYLQVSLCDYLAIISYREVMDVSLSVVSSLRAVFMQQAQQLSFVVPERHFPFTRLELGRASSLASVVRTLSKCRQKPRKRVSIFDRETGQISKVTFYLLGF